MLGWWVRLLSTLFILGGCGGQSDNRPLDGASLDGSLLDGASLDGTVLDGPSSDARPGAAMVDVPQGPFWMGCNEALDADCSGNEYPYHEVTLSAYRIDVTEVAVVAYADCVDAGACSEPDSGAACNWSAVGRGDHPINCVDWQQAADYCAWAGKRLPTEAEWEKAARGTDGRKYPWGSDAPTCSLANFYYGVGGCADGTVPVGSSPAGASPYAALNLAGNVGEWVADWYETFYYASSPSDDPVGPAAEEVADEDDAILRDLAK
jgi:formylglycine-generating enzyme required for sulfatase activity